MNAGMEYYMKVGDIGSAILLIDTYNVPDAMKEVKNYMAGKYASYKAFVKGETRRIVVTVWEFVDGGKCVKTMHFSYDYDGNMKYLGAVDE